MQNFDMLVIGSGPGGQRAAIQAAKLGRRVAIVEQQEILGGVTAHTGTIPSKTLREAVLYLCGWREKGFYGRSYRVKANITAAIETTAKVTMVPVDGKPTVTKSELNTTIRAKGADRAAIEKAAADAKATNSSVSAKIPGRYTRPVERPKAPWPIASPTS